MIADRIAGMFDRTESGTRDPLSNFWYNPVATESSSGIAVNDAVALSVSTVFACVRVLSDAMGILPCHVYERLDEDRKQRATDHPWYTTLHARPNQFQTPIEWKSMGVAHLALRGNFYNRIVEPTFAHPWMQLIPLNPDRMAVSKLQDGGVGYEYRPKAGPSVKYNQWEILHVKLLCLDGDGIVGASPLEHARDSIGITKSRHNFLGQMYKGGGFIKYFLKTDKPMNDKQRQEFRKGWRDVHGQQNGAGYAPPVLENGLTLETLGMSNDDLQTIESEEIGAIEICQYFGVPPHMVALLKRATFSNIEQQGIEFKTLHLQPWAVRFEQAVAAHFADPDRFYVEFLMDALLRGDTGSRFAAYSTATGGQPFMSVNEVRGKENLDPVEGGDDLKTPLNMAAHGPPGKQQAPPKAEAPEPENDDSEPQAAAVPITTEVVQITNAVVPDTPALDLQPLIADAAERIVKREVGALGARGDQAYQDRAAWDTWAAGYYAKVHTVYIAKTLQPLAAAAGAASCDLEVIADKYCLDSMNALSGSPVRETLDNWTETKAAGLAATITEALQC